MRIHIIDAPRITLLSDQTFHGHPGISWKSSGRDDAQTLVEFAGRLCYMSFGADQDIDGGHRTVTGRASQQEFVRNLIASGHGSVLEHAVYSLCIEGISRAVSHELVRHRAGMSYSQLSQRYVDESEVAFVRPPAITPMSHLDTVWQLGCQDALHRYRQLLAEGSREAGTTTAAVKAVREMARAVLPNCTETKIVVTGNARAWRHFMRIRSHKSADAEMRRLARAVYDHLYPQAQDLFQGGIEDSE